MPTTWELLFQEAKEGFQPFSGEERAWEHQKLGHRGRELGQGSADRRRNAGVLCLTPWAWARGTLVTSHSLGSPAHRLSIFRVVSRLSHLVLPWERFYPAGSPARGWEGGGETGPGWHLTGAPAAETSESAVQESRSSAVES